MLSDRAKEICRQAAEAFSKKGSLDNFWQETAENFYPEQASFTSTKEIGENFASNLYASEPIINRREFGNWIGSISRPKGRDWFIPRARNDDINEKPTVKSWLERRGRITRGLIYDNKSQFVRSMAAGDHDYVTFGNSSMTIEPRQDGSGLRYRNWHLKNCAWKENYDGEVDTHFRRFQPTVLDLCKRENEGWKISEKVKKRLEKEPNGLVKCVHACMPIGDFDYTIKRPKYDWVSVYYDEDNQFEMSFKPVPEFNYIVSRWFTISGSPYAFSPCVVASIPDARTLQVMTWSIIEAGEKQVEPPMAAMNEAILGGVDLRAGAITWIDQRYDERTGEALRAIELGGNPQFGEVLRQGLTGTLKEAWFLNKLFLPPASSQPMTAEEASLRNAEFLRSVQPIMDPAEAERNGKTLDLTIEMSMRLGLWGDLKTMPVELKGEHVDITYDNPIEDARRAAKASAYREAMGINAITKESGDPAVLANFDNNKAYRDAISGVAPPDWLRDEDEAEDDVGEAREAATTDKALAEGAAVAEAAGKLPPEQVAA